MGFGAFRQPGEHAVPVRGASGEEGGPGRTADGAGSVALGQAGSLFGKSVEVWGLEDRMSEAAEVAVAEVVCEEQDDVGRSGIQGCEAGECEKGREGAVHGREATERKTGLSGKSCGVSGFRTLKDLYLPRLGH